MSGVAKPGNGFPPEAAGRDTVQKPCLLVVDDDPGILSALRRLFRFNGYTVFLAAGGLEGLQLLERQAVDLVVSDMRMPGMDGACFLKQVRRRWPGMVCILLTGYADAASLEAVVSEGAIDHCVAKPWVDDQLLSLIARAFA